MLKNVATCDFCHVDGIYVINHHHQPVSPYQLPDGWVIVTLKVSQYRYNTVQISMHACTKCAQDKFKIDPNSQITEPDVKPTIEEVLRHIVQEELGLLLKQKETVDKTT